MNIIKANRAHQMKTNNFINIFEIFLLDEAERLWLKSIIAKIF